MPGHRRSSHRRRPRTPTTSAGTSYLDSGRYDRAIEAFDKVIAKNGKKADGAMYWKAYALHRLGKRDEAIRTIEELQKKFPSSRWSNDAKALLIDVRQASGQPVSPDKAGDEELKLIALNGLMMRRPGPGHPDGRTAAHRAPPRRS